MPPVVTEQLNHAVHIRTDAHPVDTGHGHSVRCARPVPDVRRVVAATTGTGPTGRPARPRGRGPGHHGPVQSGGRRRRAGRVQGPVDRHHPADRPVRGVQRRVRRAVRPVVRGLFLAVGLRARRTAGRHRHIHHHAHVQATGTGGRAHQTGPDADAGPGHTLAGRRGLARQVAAVELAAPVVRHQLRSPDR